MAVIGDGHDARLLERSDGSQFFTGNVQRECAGEVNIHHRLAFGLVLNERHRGGAVDCRGGVGHTHNRGEAAHRGCCRSGGNVFLGRLARFAKMHV